MPQVAKRKRLVRVDHDAVRGRVRFRVRSLHRIEELAPWIESQLHNEPGVRRVSASPLTGSVLIEFAHAQSNTGQLRRVLERKLAEARKLPIPLRSLSPPETEAWHSIKRAELSRRFRASPTRGLSRQLARSRLRSTGPNVTTPLQPRHPWEILTKQVNNLPTGLLAGSAALSLLSGGIADAIMILAVVLTNARIGFVSESRAEEIIASLAKPRFPQANVIRAGKGMSISAEELVPGDLLLLKSGDAVPADARLISAENLTVDESMLTGESVPVKKRAVRLQRAEVPLSERVNLVFRGTTVTGGSARALVVATGNQTEIGRIQSLMGETHRPPTPMEKELEEITGKMVRLALLASAATFAIHLLRGSRILETFRASVSLAVAAIPEGLPTVATTTLSRSVKVLQESRIIVRRLEAIETLGNIDVICLDKTGTLTENRMKVIRVSTPNACWEGEAIPAWLGSPDLGRLLEVSVLCNEADLNSGSPTETALYRMASDAGIDVPLLRKKNPTQSIRYRAEDQNYMTTVHESVDGKKLVATKGRPTEVLALCDRIQKNGRIRPLRPSDIKRIHRENDRMANESLRVLGVAFSGNPSGKQIWLGLVGMSDPLRSEAPRLIEELKRSGIRTIMLTGDQSETARSIARQLRLSDGSPLRLVDSVAHLKKMKASELHTTLRQTHVFSRVSPSHKLRIVQLLQKSGSRVAMTGDGVNDGPALRAADVGIAVGGGETEVLRKVADVILSNDDIMALMTALRQGRTVRRNLRKAVDYIVSQNLSEILFTIGSELSRPGQPLSPMQFLWVNLVTDVLPELALTREEPGQEVIGMNGHAAPFDQRDYNWLGFEAITLAAFSLLGYGYGVRKYGKGPQASTMAFMTLNSASLLHTLSSRSRERSVFGGERFPKNPAIAQAMGIGAGAEALAIVIPALRRILGTGPIRSGDLAFVGIASTLPFLVIEGAKLWRTKKRVI